MLHKTLTKMDFINKIDRKLQLQLEILLQNGFVFQLHLPVTMVCYLVILQQMKTQQVGQNNLLGYHR